MDENKDRSDADDTTAATEITPAMDLDDDDEVEVWVVNDDGEVEDDEPSEPTTAAENDPESSADPATLRRELEEARRQWMRTLADFDNFRKRAEREKGDLKQYALLEPIRDLLPVLDNLERALSADGSVEDLKLGVEMTLGQLLEVLRRRGLEPVAAVGHPFDPAVHDAVSRFEDSDVAQATVADELQRGYRIHDRLLRPAMVRVAMPPEAEGAGTNGDPES